MSFYIFFLCGILGGILGGMGMGGGTLLIPLLTLFFGVPQAVAQGVNLLSFLPMSLIALRVHAKGGRLEKGVILPVALPALLLSGAFACVAGSLPSGLLRRGFGFFLLLLSAFPLTQALKKPEKAKISS